MKNIYKYYVDCGRSGGIEGMFVATEEEVKKIIGVELYLGEVLGKHSEVIISIDENEIEVVPATKSIVKWFEKNVGSTGYDPRDYMNEDNECEEEEDELHEKVYSVCFGACWLRSSRRECR